MSLRISFALLLAFVFSNAQHKVGIHLSYGKSQVALSLIEPTANVTYANYYDHSLIGGFSYKYQFKKILGLGVDLSGSLMKGIIKVKSTETYPTPNGPLTYTNNETISPEIIYTNIPIYFSIWFNRFSLDLGYQSSCAVWRKFSYALTEEYPGGTAYDSSDKFFGEDTGFDLFDHGPFASFSFTALKHFDLFARYYKGMSNIGDGFDSQLTMKTTQITAGIKYNFFISKPKIVNTADPVLN